MTTPLHDARATTRLETPALLELYRRMLRIRGFEERASALYRDGEIPGFVHLSIGQEAVAVGACWPSRPTDEITSTHRGHGHCLAKGADMAGMFAELHRPRGRDVPRPRRVDAHRRPRARDLRRQRHRRCRAADRRGRRAGRASCAATTRSPSPSSATAPSPQGAFHEAVNLAALWTAAGPLLLREQPLRRVLADRATQHPVTPLQRAAGYGLCRASASTATTSRRSPRSIADGRGRAAGRRRAGASSRPSRTAGTATTRATRALPRGRGARRGGGRRTRWRWSRGRLDAAASARPRSRRVDREVDEEVEAAAAAARRPRPSRHRRPWATTRRVPAPPDAPRAARPRGGEVFRTMDAVRAALDDELETDPEVWVAGIDVGGGRQRLRDHPRAGRRASPGGCCDTPISEIAIIGLAVGAAMAGTKPVVELMYFDFLGVCFDQIINQAAKLRFMTGGARRRGAGRADPVRRRPFVRQPALAEPGGAPGPHPGPHRGHAVDAGRHLRAAAGGDPGPQPGRLHREPPAVRHATGPRRRAGPPGADRQGARSPAGHRRHDRRRGRGWCTSALAAAEDAGRRGASTPR